MRKFLAVALFALSGCGQDTGPDLDAFLGHWYFVDSSGGISGQGDDNYGADEIELTRDRFNKFQDGQQVSSESAIYGSRDCIDGERHLAISIGGGGAYCMELADTEFYLSQDAYDGFSYHFSRVKP